MPTRNVDLTSLPIARIVLILKAELFLRTTGLYSKTSARTAQLTELTPASNDSLPTIQIVGTSSNPVIRSHLRLTMTLGHRRHRHRGAPGQVPAARRAIAIDPMRALRWE